MPTHDAKLERVRRAFDAAAGRLRAAPTQAEVEDEVSNLLHHLYRLGELCRWKLGTPPGTKLSPERFGEELIRHQSDDLRAARAAMWLRAEDTHELVVVDMATPPDTCPDTYSDTYSDTYGTPARWKAIMLTDRDPKAKRHEDYAAVLQGELVFETMRRAFDAMAKLL